MRTNGTSLPKFTRSLMTIRYLLTAPKYLVSRSEEGMRRAPGGLILPFFCRRTSSLVTGNAPWKYREWAWKSGQKSARVVAEVGIHAGKGFAALAPECARNKEEISMKWWQGWRNGLVETSDDWGDKKSVLVWEWLGYRQGWCGLRLCTSSGACSSGHQYFAPPKGSREVRNAAYIQRLWTISQSLSLKLQKHYTMK